MKLSTKLILSFTGVIVLLLLIGIVSQYYNNKVKNKVIHESQEAIQELKVSNELQSHLYQSFINVQYYLDEPYRATLDQNLQDSLLGTENIKRKVRISLQGLNLNFKKIERLLKNANYSQYTSAEAQEQTIATVNLLKSKIETYNSFINQLLDYSQNDFQNAKSLLTVTVEPLYRNNLLPLLEQLRNKIQMNLNDQARRLNDRLDRYGNIIFLATLIAFLFTLLLAYSLYRSIAAPLHSLSEAAKEIGRGNLEKRIPVKSNDEIGQLSRSFNRMAKNLNAITFSKQYVDNIIESMGDALIVTDEKLEIIKVNSAALSLLGYRKDEIMGQPLADMFFNDENEELLNLNENSVLENYETYFQRINGDTFPVSLSKSIIYNNDETIEGAVCVVSDITERKKSERVIKNSLEEKEILLAEIHHRVKNNLAVISGLLQMQRWETENKATQEVLQDCQLRVKSIALVHEKLYQSDNLSNIQFDKYVRELVDEIDKTYANSDTDITFETDIVPIVLSINQAIPCSLLLNELIVNAHKHAFKDREDGVVRITLSRDDQLIKLTVKDDGIGMDENTGSKKSLGMSIVYTLVKQLDGTLEVRNEDGAVFNIFFTLEKKA